MPTNPLLRREIIDAYYNEVHPTGEPVPELPSDLQQSALAPTFGISFSSELDVAPSELPDRAGDSAASSVAPPGPRITPMLHQERTARDVLDGFRKRITTTVLGDPLGAGKTYEALWVYLHLRQTNPNLGMVITVPDVVIPDWLEALSNLGIAESNCQIITVPKEIASVDMCKPPTILLVKQSLSLRDDPRHLMAFNKMQAMYALPRLHVFDENTSANKTISALYDCAKHNPRLTLSGTVVTSSIQDFSTHFVGIQQLGASKIHSSMSDLSGYFSRYHTTSFAGTDRSIPGAMFLNLLNVSTFTHPTLHSRMPSSLPIGLPQARENFLCIDRQEGRASDAAVSKTRAEPAALLTEIGASVTVDGATNCLFLESHSERWYPSKLQRLIAECNVPRPPSEITDFLVVTANQNTSYMLMRDLPEAVAAARYTRIHIRDKRREQKIQDAHAAGLSIIFVTESAQVEGFNVQEHLGKIIFFDAVREAGIYTQGVGRGVRMGNQKPRVDIQQYCTSQTADYVKERLLTTRRAKVLLELIHADPAAIFLLLNLDVLTRHRGKLRRPEVSFENILSSMHTALASISKNLEAITKSRDSHQVIINLIGLLTCAKPHKFDLSKWQESYPIQPPLPSGSFFHLFLFEEGMLRFSFDQLSTGLFTSIERCMAVCKEHFLTTIASLDLSTLLQPAYLDLACGFNRVGDYLLALQRLIERAPTLSKVEAFNALKIVYSSTKEVFPEHSAIQASLLHRLKENGFFNELSCEELVNDPFLLFAFVDANFESIDISRQLRLWFADALRTQPEQMYQVLCQFSAYLSENTVVPLKPILAPLYTELKRFADSMPGAVYPDLRYDILAEHFGKQAEWVERLCAFAEQLGPDAELLRSNISARCTKLLKACSKPERRELHAKHDAFLNPVRQPRAAAAFEEESTDGSSKRRRVYTASHTTVSDGAAAAQTHTSPAPLPPLPQQRYAFFQPGGGFPSASMTMDPPLPMVLPPGLVLFGVEQESTSTVAGALYDPTQGAAASEYSAPPSEPPSDMLGDPVADLLALLDPPSNEQLLSFMSDIFPANPPYPQADVPEDPSLDTSPFWWSGP